MDPLLVLGSLTLARRPFPYGIFDSSLSSFASQATPVLYLSSILYYLCCTWVPPRYFILFYLFMLKWFGMILINIIG
jgi:hypothetical protein